MSILLRDRMQARRAPMDSQTPAAQPASIKKAASSAKPGMSANQKVAAAQAGAQILSQSGAVDQESSAGGAIGGAASGAATGAAFGPKGAAIGAAVGAIGGVLSSRAKRKQRARDAKAQSLRNIAQIHQQTAQQSQAALGSIIEGFRSALIRR